MNRHFSAKNTINKFVFLGFCVLIIINPFPLGSNRDWAWSVEAIWSLLLIVILFISSIVTNNKVMFSQLKALNSELILIGFWLLTTLIYILPIPVDFLQILSPKVAESYVRQGVNKGYLSLDVDASYKAFMLSFYYCIVFLLGIMLINSRKRITIMLVLFLILGVIESIYGMYLRSIGQTGTLIQVNSVSIEHASGTFINKNHFVAYLSMCFFMGLSLRFIIVRFNEFTNFESIKIKFLKYLSSPLLLIDFCLFIILAGIWSAHSRAGVLSFIVATIVFFITVSNKNKASLRIVIFVLFSLLFITVFFSQDLDFIIKSLGINSDKGLSNVLAHEIKGRMLAIQQVVNYYPLYWVFGVGPGAYQVFFVNHRSTEQIAFFDHAHNDYLEFLVEYGVFSLIILALLILISVRIVKLLFNSKSLFYKYLGISILCTVLYMLLHGSMDFNARIPANVVTIIVVISMIYNKIIRKSLK